jgi:hypothetical protein
MGQDQVNSLDGPDFANEPNATILASQVPCVGLCLSVKELKIMRDIQVF